jgi:hypothetical protein
MEVLNLQQTEVVMRIETLFNVYATLRDRMEDAALSVRPGAKAEWERLDRLANKIDNRISGVKFCPVCGRGHGGHESNCARKLRIRAQIDAIYHAQSVYGRTGRRMAIDAVADGTLMDYHAAADYVADLDEWVS